MYRGALVLVFSLACVLPALPAQAGGFGGFAGKSPVKAKWRAARKVVREKGLRDAIAYMSDAKGQKYIERTADKLKGVRHNQGKFIVATGIMTGLLGFLSGAVGESAMLSNFFLTLGIGSTVSGASMVPNFMSSYSARNLLRVAVHTRLKDTRFEKEQPSPKMLRRMSAALGDLSVDREVLPTKGWFSK